jgi:hypothetical protein
MDPANVITISITISITINRDSGVSDVKVTAPAATTDEE